MDILYLLIPLSTLLVLAIVGVFAWALRGGQFEELEREGHRILETDRAPLDQHQVASSRAPQQFLSTRPSDKELRHGDPQAPNRDD